MAERKPFLLRLPPDLYDELSRWAADELRSLNAQIEYVLRDAARRRRRTQGGAGPQSGSGPPREDSGRNDPKGTTHSPADPAPAD